MARELGPGAVVADRFVLVRPLGSGTSGQVWLATDRVLMDREIALKILHEHFEDQPGPLERLLREAQLLARLQHPGIAQPVAVDVAKRAPYLAMEYVPGQPLHEVLAERRGQPFSPAELRRLFGELASAVGYAHEQAVVHRDLKPQNVMIARRGGQLFVKVLDFGVAKLVERSSDGTTHGRTIGSLFYMSPEQTRGEPASSRSDVFALGAILFELLTLRRCWAWDRAGVPLPAFTVGVNADGTNTIGSVFERINRAERPRVAPFRPDLSPRLDLVIARALAIRPEQRPASAERLHALFLEALDGPADAPLPVGEALGDAAPTLDAPLAEPTRATFVRPVQLAGAEEELSTLSPRAADRTTVDAPAGGATPRLPTAVVPGGVEALLGVAPTQPVALPSSPPAAAASLGADTAMVALELPATRVLDPALRAPTPSALGLALGLTPSELSAPRPRPSASRPWRWLAVASLGAAALIVAWATLIERDRAVLDTSTTEIVDEPAPLVVGATAPSAAPVASAEPSSVDPATKGADAPRASPTPAAAARPATPRESPAREGATREGAAREAEARRSSAAKAPASAHGAALRRANLLLAAARAEPTAQRTSDAARAILVAAERVGDTEARTSIQRIAQTAGMVGDLSSLEDAYQELDRALAREAAAP